MASKPQREKKVSMVKPLTRHHGNKKDPETTPTGRLSRMEIAEGNLASEMIARRPTKDFSREELGSLMQVPPGGAEVHQIKTKSRQFNRVASDMPEATVNDRTVGVAGDGKRRPMSAKTPKIDIND
jgi:hypothetical protein